MDDSNKWLGIQFMALAAFFFSLMGLFVKWAGESIPSQEIVFVRSLLVLIFAYIWLRWTGTFDWGENKLFLVLRGVAGFSALTCFYYALTELPLADAMLIHFINPVFVAVLAAIFLGEALEWDVLVSMFLSLAGIVFIMEPAFLFSRSISRLPLIPVLVGLGGALSSATAYVIVRQLRETEEPMTIVFYFPLVATPLALPTAIPGAVWPTPIQWAILLAIGVVTLLGQVFLTKGLHLVEAGRASAVTYLQVVFAFIWGIVFFGEYPTVWSTVGAGCIVSGILLTTQRA
jgi:drug/metabolite transporter (DMT)-like permease